MRKEAAAGAELFLADCLVALKAMPDNSVDSIVTDPPYGLSFMGKKWDYDVPSVEVWAECLRVLKPGGHLLAFAGTRTQHRMAVRIEDAGFEIRDMIAWVYSQGFPKSLNLDRQKGEVFCGCEGANEPTTERGVHSLRDADVPAALDSCEGRGEVLQPGVSEQGEPVEGRVEFSSTEVRSGQPGVEGWGNTSPSAGELRSGEVRESAGLGGTYGAQGRLCDGAPADNGEAGRAHAAAAGSGASPGSRSAQQRTDEPRIVAGQPGAQARGAWPLCGRCGKPRIPSGLGTSLKPALEPITVARKPLIGTVAANVLQHGTGAINVDGCRVDATGDAQLAEKFASVQNAGRRENSVYGSDSRDRAGAAPHPAGRFPANLIHDGSDEVVAGFPQSSAKNGVTQGEGKGGIWSESTGKRAGPTHGDTGSAARFFYCAKASKKDRGEGNTHPTVKPTELMRYLCRLVTPPGGTVLDPFMGSGSTGKAALLEGFVFIGIEREQESFDTAAARIGFAGSARAVAAAEAAQMELL